MNHETLRYEQALKKQLRCTHTTRKHLLRQFHGFLIAFLEDHPSPTEADLRDAFGPPEDMAKVLVENINKAEIAQFDRQQKWKRIMVTILVALLLVLMVYIFFWKEKPVVGVSEIIEGTTVTSDKGVGE